MLDINYLTPKLFDNYLHYYNKIDEIDYLRVSLIPGHGFQ